jgi:hypothetical protein
VARKPPVTDGTEAARRNANAVKARAWDTQRLAERNVPRLRERGLDEAADLLEKVALRARREAENLDRNGTAV